MTMPDPADGERSTPVSPIPLPVIGGHLDGRVVALTERSTVLNAPLVPTDLLAGHLDLPIDIPVHKWRRTPSCWIWEGPMPSDPDPFPPRMSLFRSPRRSTP